MQEMKQKAKRMMLDKLRKKMRDMDGEGIAEGLGVTVKAKDEESLMEGLDKAKEVIESGEVEEMREKAEEKMEDYEEDMEEEAPEMSQEEIMERIEELKKMLK